MSKVFIEENSLTSIADTIRKYTGNDSKLSVPNGFKEAIRNLVTTEETQTGSVLILNDIPNGTGNISEVHLFGKSEQKTTKGIQLLNLKDAKGGTGDGVTYTPNGDGSFKKTGTATG